MRRLGLVALVLTAVVVLGVVLGAAVPAGAGPVHVTAPAQVPNPANWLLQQVFANPFKSSAKKTIAAALQDSEAAFLTPDVSTQTRVHDIWVSMLVVADSLLLMLLVVGGVMIVAGDWTYLEAKEIAPRAVIAGLGANLSLLLLGQGIAISNELVHGFLQVDPNSLSITAERLLGTAAVAPLVVALLMVGALFLLVSNIVRIIVVILLGVGGPVLQVFGVLPVTDGIARGWWRAGLAVLLAPAVQALLLTVGFKIFFSGGSTTVIPGAHPGSGSLTDLVVILVIIVLMAMTPLWMLRTAIGVTHHHIRSTVRFSLSAAGVRP
jgi:hypothetical protein